MNTRNAIEYLISVLEREAQIYQEILRKTERLETRWSESLHLSSDKSDKIHEEQERSEDMNDLESLLVWRREKLEEISLSRMDSYAKRQAVCNELGVNALDAAAIGGRFPELVEPWLDKVNETERFVALIKESDERLSKKLNMEVEYTKLEMHRLQNVKKSREIYQTRGIDESFFVDKNR
ncbi:MAG: hypothetical protein FWG40_03545 [Peptococcaceae bacterium]|nr:hypothetical protein [Peptococcaceae bacterium]